MLLKRFFSMLLVVIVLAQSLSTMLTLAAFQMNRQYYAEVLCINKNRPELACQGKCVLMQKLQAEYNEQEQHQNLRLTKLLELDLAWVCETPFVLQTSSLPIVETLTTTLPLAYLSRRSQTFGRGIFHPPSWA
jgi:hypothetical protein